MDNTGRIGVCWYDRRMDPTNLLIDRFCGISNDAGLTFTNLRQSRPSWAPIHGSDVFIDPTYMGDYDVVASDFTKAASGFIQAYQVISRRAAIGGVPEADPDVFATTLH